MADGKDSILIQVLRLSINITCEHSHDSEVGISCSIELRYSPSLPVYPWLSTVGKILLGKSLDGFGCS